MADVWPSRRFLNGKYSKQLQLLAILARRCFFDMIYILCAIGDASKQISRSICYSEVYIYKLYVYIYICMYVSKAGKCWRWWLVGFFRFILRSTLRYVYMEILIEFKVCGFKESLGFLQTKYHYNIGIMHDMYIFSYDICIYCKCLFRSLLMIVLVGRVAYLYKHMFFVPLRIRLDESDEWKDLLLALPLVPLHHLRLGSWKWWKPEKSVWWFGRYMRMFIYIYLYCMIYVVIQLCVFFSNVQLILTQKKKFTAILGWLQRSHWMFTQEYVSTIPKLTDIFQLDSSRKQVGMWKYPPWN